MGITWWRGTKGLESIEIAAVTIKLSIIIGILFALAVYDGISGTRWFQHGAIKPLSTWDTFAMLAGMLMVTQGFETARFMGAEYSQKVRVNAVIYSQRISIVLYVLFIGLTCPIFLTFPILELNETAISQTLGNAIYIAPLFLLIAAISSQLSAALADTLGGGGLLKELIPSKVSNRFYYMAITFVALILTWTQNIFEIINLASKGFAIYYLLQVIIRMMANDKKSAPTARYTSLIGNAALVLILMFVILWSIPAPHE